MILFIIGIDVRFFLVIFENQFIFFSWIIQVLVETSRWHILLSHKILDHSAVKVVEVLAYDAVLL